MLKGLQYITLTVYDCLKNTPVVIMDHFFTKERGDEENPDPDAILIPDEKHQGIKKVFDFIPTKKVHAEKTGQPLKGNKGKGPKTEEP